MSAVQHNCTEGYLNGCTCAVVSNYFRGYVNLPNLVADELSYFLMGINILEPNLMLTFGDKLPDTAAGNLIFVGATYQRKDGGMSDVITLEPACFEKWFPQSPGTVSQPPMLEEWCIIPINEFLEVIKNETDGGGGNHSFFKEFALFKDASTKCIESLATLKSSRGPIPNRIFCLPDRIEVENADASGSDSSTDEGEGEEEGDEVGEETNNEDIVMEPPAKTPPKKRNSRTAGKQSTRRSLRANTLENIVDGLGDIQTLDDDPDLGGSTAGFNMPRRSGRSKKSEAISIAITTGSGVTKATGKVLKKASNNKKESNPKKPPRKYNRKNPNQDDPVQFTPVNPKNITCSAPAAPPTVHATKHNNLSNDNFTTFLDQQHKTLDYDERLVGNYLTFAERYNNR